MSLSGSPGCEVDVASLAFRVSQGLEFRVFVADFASKLDNRPRDYYMQERHKQRSREKVTSADYVPA